MAASEQDKLRQQASSGALREKANEGTLPHNIFSSEAFFELEKEKIFQKAWILLGHECEIPDPGDYIVRYICDDNLIVTRDESGEIRVFFNECKHQGMKVCRTEMGNTSHFRCPYHGWTFANSGDLTGVPFKHETYDDESISDISLDEPRYDTYNGLIFANLDEDAESLKEYLGDFTFYLDFFVGRSPEGMEVNGPQRRIIDANWKLGSMNTMSDHYHSVTTHRSVSDIDLMEHDEEDAGIAAPRYHVQCDAGGLMMRENNFFKNHEMRDSIKQAFSEEQWDLVSGDIPMGGNGSMLPNVNMLAARVQVNEGESAPITYIRTYRPIGPDKTEVYTWHVVEKDAPEELKEKSRQGYEMAFGISGMIEQDDLGNWSSVTEVGKGGATGNHDVRIDMHLKQEEASDWDRPGKAYKAPFSEVNMRYFYNWLFDYLEA
ncbi:aromatic ring-hydroxylating oxygenase subunit alpha [Halobellus captivus]|uniref:aromatic ring-hydroxylating oxygenase subunit alpha n=1 Tax=Halobellus captivus TaxID=2592614 RepID=UPI00119F1AA4|nr:Rieske 2Fe-2S domain-containing protein [Halobellus captivus]